VSPLWRDKFGVALFPDRLLLVRAGGRARARITHKDVIGVMPASPGTPLWQPALEALAGQVAAGTMKGAEVSVVLSSHFVHYVLVPHSDVLANPDEEMAFARHCFARVHGEQAEGWRIKLSPAGEGSARLACGVEQTLVDGLEKVMAPIGNSYRSMQPHLMASFNRWRTRLGKRPGWFVVAEPDLLCLSLLRDGNWQSVRTVKAGADWPAELPGVLMREECLVDSDADCDEVYVFAPDGPDPLILSAGKWRFTSLLPTLLPRMSAGADAQFSIALGA
jgi:hypothetical protein